MPAGEADTTVAFEAVFRQRLMQKSGVERLRMACDMFDAASALIVASLGPDVAVDPVERRIAVFRRMYWPERYEPLIESLFASLRFKARRPDGVATSGAASASGGVVDRHGRTARDR